MITLSYTCKSSRISPARVDVQQSLTFRAGDFSPIEYEEQKVDSYAWNGRTKKTVVFGEWRYIKITAACIDDADLEQWKEFIESVRRGEAFTIDASSQRGVNETITAFIPDKKHKIGRENDLAKYNVTFTAREVVDT